MPTDRDLVRRFADSRCEESFAVLVRRHGAMVMDVCRHYLRREHEAEDAFQATFLVLARKANSTRWGPCLGPWLYQVAVRVAVNARRKFARRREVPLGDAPIASSLEDISARETREVLDAALMGLSRRYRDPLVLFYLEGRSRTEISDVLGIAPATVKTRLQRGRAQLRRRLVVRGLLVAVATATTGSRSFASDGVSQAAVSNVCEAVGASNPSPSVADLVAEEVQAVKISSLGSAKVFSGLAAAALVIVLLGGSGLLITSAAPGEVSAVEIRSSEKVSTRTSFGFAEPDRAVADARAPGAGSIRARGHVESAAVWDVRCEVSSRGGGVVRIVEIVPEGSLVEEGQILAKLDSSALEEQRSRQQILRNTSEAALIDAKHGSELPTFELEAYKAGVFPLERQEYELAILVAEENYRRAKQELDDVEKSGEEGQIPQRLLEVKRYAVAKAEKELGLASLRLEVLEKYTSRKTIKQLEGQVAIAQARLQAEQQRHRVNLARLEEIERQMEGCVIKAPAAGRVVYAAPPPGRAAATGTTRTGGRPMLSEGAQVRHGQPMMSIHDPEKLQFEAVFSGVEATRLKAGAAATIRVDAYPDRDLKGVVESVNELPAGPTPVGGSRKPIAREVRIRVIDSPEILVSGLTGEVTIQSVGRKAEKGRPPAAETPR